MPRLFQHLTLALAAMVILPALNAQADIVSFRQGVGGYTGAQDTFLFRASPDANQSGADPLVLQGAPGNFLESNGLILFSEIFGNAADLIPRGHVINSATLTLATESGTGNTISGHRLLMNWDDDATWNNSFGGDGVQANDVEAASAVDFVYTANSQPQIHSIDVTETLQAWSLDTDSAFGWVLYKGAAGGTYRVNSSEATGTAFRPMLTVDYSAVPEPSSVAFLIGMGAIGLAGGLVRRRMKRNRDA